MSIFTNWIKEIENIKDEHTRNDLMSFYVINYMKENDCCLSNEDWTAIMENDFDPWCLMSEVTEHWTKEKIKEIALIWWNIFKKISIDDYGMLTEQFLFWLPGTDQYYIFEAFEDFFDIDVIKDKDFMGLDNSEKNKKESKEMITTPMTSCGYYMNIWDDMGNYDCFIRFHEAESNDYITKAIEETEDVCHHIMQNKHMGTKEKQKLIIDLLDTYTDLGVQVIIITDKTKERK